MMVLSAGERKIPLPSLSLINRATMKGNKMTDKTFGTFGTFVEPEKSNKYDETMAAFAKAVETNPDASWTVEVDASKETVERNLIAKAANNVGHTARLRHADYSKRTQVGTREKSGNPVYQGISVLTFTLTDKHKARRGNAANDKVTAK